MFMAGSFLAGLGGALVTPVRSIVPGMDVDIIVEAFIVVVIGGLGSFWGTFSARSCSGRCWRSASHPAGLLAVCRVRPDGAGADRAPLRPARPADEGVSRCAGSADAVGHAGVRRGGVRAVARLALLYVPGD
jgi:hypothetical protein